MATRSFPSIETRRLILGALKASDIPSIVDYASNRKVSQYTLNLPHPYSEQDAIYWLNMANEGFASGKHYVFAIRLKPTERIIGGIGLGVSPRFKRAEIGYWIAEHHWGAGYATEATVAAIDFGFKSLDLNKLTSSYLAGNPASGAVMRNCGMSKEGVLKEHILKDGSYHDLILYGLTRRQFEAYERDREG